MREPGFELACLAPGFMVSPWHCLHHLLNEVRVGSHGEAEGNGMRVGLESGRLDSDFTMLVTVSTSFCFLVCKMTLMMPTPDSRVIV